tara:strand:- start:595 stop:723 length:129 start_codon:yes stop_codon:yes gene_type:complete
MDTFNIILIGTGVIAAGWLAGRMIHNFVDFVVEAIKKEDRDD